MFFSGAAKRQILAGLSLLLTTVPVVLAQDIELTSTPEPVALSASILKTDNLPVDLASVLHLVEDQNLTIAQSEKNTEILQSRLRQNQVSLLPSITGTYGNNWQQGQQRFISGGSGGFVGGLGGGGKTASTGTQQFVQAQLGASWTIYPGGRTIYQILAAKRRKVSADSLLKETYQEQLSAAAQEYYKLLAAYREKDVILQGLAEAQEQINLNQAKVEVGSGIPLDLSRAKTNYAQQQTALVQAENAIVQAEQTLINRLNLEPMVHLIPSQEDARSNPLVPEDIPVDRLIARAIETNPSLKTGEEELRALQYDYKTVRSDLIPSVTLQTYTRGTGSAITDMQRSNAGGFSVSTNLLENMGLQVPFRMREKKKLIEQKELAQKQLLRNVQSQVMTAYLNSKSYKSAVEAARQEVSSAEESYELATGRFKAGYGVNLDVLDAQVALIKARSNLTKAVLNYNQAQVQLVQAMGKVTPVSLISGLSMNVATQGTDNDSTP